MPKRLPTYSLHKGTGQARVWLNGKDHYLGTYGSEESRIRYAELLKSTITSTAIDPFQPSSAKDPGPTVKVVCAAFLAHAETYYVKNGQKTAEVDCIKSAMGHLCTLHGDVPAKDFGPMALKTVRQRMVESKGKKTGKPLCRDFINKSIERIRRIFKYAVENEMIPAAVLVGLQSVPALQSGRTQAKDYRPRKALPPEQIEAVRKHVNQRTRDLMDLAILTAARPGELVQLTAGMIDSSEDVWCAVLDDHKMSHREDRIRVLLFGPKAQAILKRYITADRQLRLFNIQRKTFSDNIKRACIALGIPPFTGHWLRHCAATEIRKSHGLDACQMILGHASKTTTERYAHPATREAIEVARQVG